MPAYNEEQSITKIVRDFDKDYVNEIIVVDNNSTDNTAALAKKAGAKVVKEHKQGQGYAMKKALSTASGDIVILTESDCTFQGSDMAKLLAYADEFDVVLGSRVNKQINAPGAIKNYVIIGNYFLAKLMQFLWRSKTSLNDVGVTFKAFNRKALEKILPEMRIGGPDACPEHIFLALRHNFKIVQIPTKYCNRKGQTKQSFNMISSIKIGFMHFVHIVMRRFLD